jgi:hypothetical protein
MDASLFLYWEDTDLSFRLRRDGWLVRYEPTAVVHHQHAASSGTRSAVFRFHNERNRLVVLTRHAPARLVLTALGRHLARTLLSAAHGRWPLVRTHLRALGSYCVRLPGALRQRRLRPRGPGAATAPVPAA